MGDALALAQPLQQGAGDDAGREHRVRRQGSCPSARLLDAPPTEQQADIVTGQALPQARLRLPLICDGHRQRDSAAVGIRVVGDDDVRVDLAGRGEGEVECAGFLRVGECDRGELRVGQGLLGHLVDVGEPGPSGDGAEGLAADSVHRCVHDAQPARSARVEHVPGALDVRLQDGVVQGEPFLPARDLMDRADLGHECGDARVNRRDDLRAAVVQAAAGAQVDLVAVVLGGVVAGSDHDAGGGLEVLHGEGEHRRRAVVRHHGHGQPEACEHRAGVARELRGVVAGVVADHDQARLVALGNLVQERRQRRGRAHHHRRVHPVRPRPESRPQPGGAEAE